MKKITIILILFAVPFSLFSQSGIGAEMGALSRKIVMAFQVHSPDPYKNNVAVSDFEEQGREAEENSIGATAASLLITELKKSGEFDLVDRENLARAVEEIKFSLTGLTDEEESLEIGKIASANYFINGDVSVVEDYYIINVRMTDVETGKVLLSEKTEFGTAAMNDFSVVLFTEPKDPIVAGFRSALIPGWGQFYNQKSIKGGVMLSLFVASTLTAGTSKILAELTYSDYKAVGSWLPPIDAEGDEYYADLVDDEVWALRDEAAFLYDQAAFLDEVALYALIGYGGILVWSVIDALVEAAVIQRQINDARESLEEEQRPEVGFFFLPEPGPELAYRAGIRIEM